MLAKAVASESEATFFNVSASSLTSKWEPCHLSHIRIYNKSVLEWEVTAGLRYKPDAFVKVLPRCEAPKRDMMYPANHTPCRYVCISCLRGSPIAIFSSSYLKTLQAGYHHFCPRLRMTLRASQTPPESSVRFLALLAGPFYPILHLINERDTTKMLISSADSDTLKSSLASTPTISSNFEAQPRRSRNPSSVQPASCLLAFRSETDALLLRKAHKDKTLGIVCHQA